MIPFQRLSLPFNIFWLEIITMVGLLHVLQAYMDYRIRPIKRTYLNKRTGQFFKVRGRMVSANVTKNSLDFPTEEVTVSQPGFRNWVPKIASCKIFGCPNF